MQQLGEERVRSLLNCKELRHINLKTRSTNRKMGRKSEQAVCKKEIKMTYDKVFKFIHNEKQIKTFLRYPLVLLRLAKIKRLEEIQC